MDNLAVNKKLIVYFMINDPIIEQLKKDIQQHKTFKQVGRLYDVSGTHIKDVLAGLRFPGNKLAKAMGFERVVTFRKKKKGEGRDE